MDGASKQAGSLTSSPKSGRETGRPLSSNLDHADVVDDWLDSIEVQHWPALYDHLRQGAAQLQREFALLDHDCDDQTAQSVALLVCCAAAHELSPMELYCLLESPQRSTLDGITRLQVGAVVDEHCECSGSSVAGRDAGDSATQCAEASDVSSAGRADVSHRKPAPVSEAETLGHSSGNSIIESKES